MNFKVIVLSIVVLSGCAQTSVVLIDDTIKLSPSQSVLILDEPPSEPFKILARLETRGSQNQSIPPLLNQMRDEAKKIGADAIIPVEEREGLIRQQLMYNPWLGGYQTTGGNRYPIVTSYAIVYEKFLNQRLARYKPAPIVNGGASFNTLALALNGVGFSAWLGKNVFRTALDYYYVDIPAAMLRDGFMNGNVDSGLRLSFDYFFMGNLKGPYMGLGFQSASYSAGHQNTTQRGEYETLDFITSVGYKQNLTPNLHLDLRIALDAVIYGEDQVMVGNNVMVPDDVGFYGMVGFGFNF